MSLLLYRVFFINPLLKCLEEHKIDYKIGSIHVGTPTCADGVLLISKSLYELQTMLLIQEDYANKERYFISESKSKLMTINSKTKIPSETSHIA